jgi:hypothetical protein
VAKPIFIRNQSDAAIVSAVPDKIERKPDEGSEDEYDSLEGAMSELHSALNAKKYNEAAKIFRSAFELMDSQPHAEGPHTNGN